MHDGFFEITVKGYAYEGDFLFLYAHDDTNGSLQSSQKKH